MTDQNTITNDSGDPKYYIMTPQIVLALCTSPYEYTLWNVIKNISGELGECFVSTTDLATLGMMSTGKCSECRQSLIAKGLLTGELRKDPGYPQPVWHLTVPNLWAVNTSWREAHQSLLDRIKIKEQQMKALHEVKPSPGEGGISPGEGGISPGETKNNQQEEQKEQPPVVVGNILDYLASLPVYQPGKKQVAQPDGFQQHFGYRQEVLKAYNDETNLVPNQGRKAILAELAARPGFDLEKFKTVLHKFNVSGGSPYDIEAIVKAYDGGSGNGNGKARIPMRHPLTNEIIEGAFEL